MNTTKEKESRNKPLEPKVSFSHQNGAYVVGSHERIDDRNGSQLAPRIMGNSPLPPPPEENNAETRCGLLCCHPNCLQKAVHRVPLIIFLCCMVIAQSMVQTGLISSINTTLEKRFQLKTREVGYIITVYETVSVLCTFFISYFGHRSNRASLIGSFGLLIMIGYIIFVLPHFINDDYVPKRSVNNKCQLDPNKRQLDNCDSSINPNFIALGIFCGAQVLNAIGASPIYVLGPTYLWDNLTAKQYPLYGSFIYVCAALGPAMGFVFGGVFLDMYVDSPKRPPPEMDSSHSEWLGAWWIGITMSIGLVIIAAVPLMFFPKRFPAHLLEKQAKAEINSMEKQQKQNGIRRPQKLSDDSQPSSKIAEVESNVDKTPSPEEVEPVFILPFIQRSASCVQEKSSRKISTMSDSRAMNRERKISAEIYLKPSTKTDVRRNSSTVSNPDIVKKKDKVEGLGNLGDIKDLPRALCRVLSNKIWLGITGLTVVENLIANAFIVYVSKYLQSMFRVPASKASFMTGGVIVPSAVLGIVLGGYLMRRFEFTVNGASKFIFGLCCSTTIITFVLMFMSCSTPSLVGTNVNYNLSRTTEKSPIFLSKELTNLTNECNANCSCTNYVYDPVCGGNTNDNYFSPCYAGCVSVKTFINSDGSTSKNYTDCSCISSGYAIEGICEMNCSSLYYALVLVFLQVFLTSMGLMPANIVTLKSASADDSSFALGSQVILVRLLAFIPAPIVFGYIFDSMCLFRSRTCAEEGACLEYDLSKLAYLFLGSLCGLKLLGILFSVITWLLSRNIDSVDINNEEFASKSTSDVVWDDGVHVVSYSNQSKSKPVYDNPAFSNIS